MWNPNTLQQNHMVQIWASYTFNKIVMQQVHSKKPSSPSLALSSPIKDSTESSAIHPNSQPPKPLLSSLRKQTKLMRSHYSLPRYTAGRQPCYKTFKSSFNCALDEHRKMNIEIEWQKGNGLRVFQQRHPSTESAHDNMRRSQKKLFSDKLLGNQHGKAGWKGLIEGPSPTKSRTQGKKHFNFNIEHSDNGSSCSKQKSKN